MKKAVRPLKNFRKMTEGVVFDPDMRAYFSFVNSIYKYLVWKNPENNEEDYLKVSHGRSQLKEIFRTGQDLRMTWKKTPADQKVIANLVNALKDFHKESGKLGE